MIQTCPNVETVKEETATDWQQIGLNTLAILAVPVIWLVGLFLSYFIAIALVGAFYLGRMLALLILFLLLPLMDLLHLAQETRNNISLVIHCVTCPLGVIFAFSMVWH